MLYRVAGDWSWDRLCLSFFVTFRISWLYIRDLGLSRTPSTVAFLCFVPCSFNKRICLFLSGLSLCLIKYVIVLKLIDNSWTNDKDGQSLSGIFEIQGYISLCCPSFHLDFPQNTTHENLVQVPVNGSSSNFELTWSFEMIDERLLTFRDNR